MNKSLVSVTGRQLYWLFTVLVPALPLLLLSFWMMADLNSLLSFVHGANLNVSQITFGQRASGFIISLVAMLPIIFALTRLRVLFALYAQGILFSRKNVIALRDTGISFIIYAIIDLLTFPLFAIAMTYSNPVGQRTITMGISSSAFGSICLGLTVLALAKAMNEARLINDELALTV